MSKKPEDVLPGTASVHNPGQIGFAVVPSEVNGDPKLPSYSEMPGPIFPPSPPAYNNGIGFENLTKPIISQATTSIEEDPFGKGPGTFAFSEKSIRAAFIRKVYLILMCQLAITVAIGAVFATNYDVKLFVWQHRNIPWLAFFVMFGCLIVMACFDDARRKAPLNYIFLLIFTLAQAFLIGCFVSVHRLDSVIWAVAICSVVCLGLTIFAFQTRIDFTLMGGFLYVSVLILFIGGLLLLIFPDRRAHLLLAMCGALIFSLYIVYDTQLMIGGEHKYSITPEEYIFAALNLYIDIVNLFLYILSMSSNK